jgi:plastocyanin
MGRMPHALRGGGCALVAVLAASILAAPAAAAPAAAGKVVKVSAAANGAQRLTYRIGPFKIIPGQNEIGNRIIDQKPQVDGFITRIRPDLTYTNGKVPGVDVIHLHHGVWLNLGARDATSPGFPERFVAAGEEKTIMKLPKGYGYASRGADRWLLNHMIHNLTPVPTTVYMTYEIDFIPRSSPRARGIRPVTPIWMDVQNGSGYPVFNVEKGAGENGRYTYPDGEPSAYGAGPRKNEWVVDRAGVLVSTAGHLHPGGLWTDLWVRRKGATIRRPACSSRHSGNARRRCLRSAPRGRGNNARLFRSKAKYFDPAGAVSWDVAMTATRSDWAVRVRKGDVLWTSATYDTKRAAWWESMGIMLVFMAESGPGKDPFKRRVNFPGRPTHGHLPENDNHGGDPSQLPDPRKLPDGAAPAGAIDILDFKYTLGDLSLAGTGGRPPVVQPGQSLRFRNGDDTRRIYHSLTSCKAPCNRSTGIAYPIADGPVQFDSNTLGSAVPPATGELEWQTPPDLDVGTYTYFCRIHPFMRGAFRVKE